MDFLTAYKTFCEGPIENTLPSSLDVSLGQQYLTQILKKSICTLLNEKGLKQPQTFAEELWGIAKKHLIHVSSLEANEIADCFYNNLFENEHFLLLKPVHYVIQEFLKNLRLDIILREKDAYTLHKPVRHKFQRNRVFVSDIDRQFQADLVDMQSLAEFNKGLKDLQGEEIKGTYYEAELQKVVDSGFYPVENVIKQRKRGGITEYFVKFLGYPEKFNDWVTDIQKV
ncbi:chromo domain-containing protein [Trichonephila clavipes]|nr:chromo domain-containing protein [Trichonephila clavipes]